MLRVKGRAAATDLTLSVDRMVSQAVRAVPRYFQPRRRTVLLIHGYNVKESEAAVTLDAFRSFLRDFHAPLAGDTFTVGWPGKRPLGFADYPLTTRQARIAGLTLFQAMRDLCRQNDAAELIVVAHSLGCRVALEALRRLSHFRDRPRRLTVILMAAAVPVTMVRSGGKLECGVRLVHRIAALHSRSDWVLAGAFRLGQTLGGEGRFPIAVGSGGEPFAPEQRHDLHPAGHGGYWSSRKAAQIVCRLTGVPTAAAAHMAPVGMTPELPLGLSVMAPPLPMA